MSDYNNDYNNNKIIIINTLFNVKKRREWSPSLPSLGLVFKRSISRSNWNLEVLIFVEGGKTENSEKNLGTKQEPTTNSTHMRRRLRESNPGHQGGRRVLIHCASHGLSL